MGAKEGEARMWPSEEAETQKTYGGHDDSYGHAEKKEDHEEEKACHTYEGLHFQPLTRKARPQRKEKPEQTSTKG